MTKHEVEREFLTEDELQAIDRKAGKKITGLSDRVVKNLMEYHWPGNIRELENIIERSVLLAKGTIIDDAPLPATQKKIFNWICV